ncbi:cobalt-precorrin 5A hydrolase [Desulfitobacterium chlororespirans]|uniref:Cobalt-precorrin 5A acetaldehyde-lyase n=1 Tax=Desulfitobacterium chlororespirans DSM 11544 TaxID=1121395 RepID=A0A1M7T2W3_9FIRM|nr:cobalt-precorrin 5A hydrolase [Desulfitobacterium chlororespirans]SHN65026.1 cobalt-precorrin 5A acetaldehyde-lyase [Desulfitobacterium chlororespirans DSM 11544]
MKTAIVVLRDQGLKTACRIMGKWPEEEGVSLYLHRRLQGQEHVQETEEVKEAPSGLTPHYFDKLNNVLPELWESSSLLIFIMATGIVVRHIAPFLQGKDRDPAVLVLDEKGEFVISLLSGHLGGANAWAKSVAQWLNAQPVITTATDVQGLTAPDEYARRFGWSVEPLSGLKEVNSLLLEQGYLKVWTDCLPEEHPLRQDPHYRFLRDNEKEHAQLWITAEQVSGNKMPGHGQLREKSRPLRLLPKIYGIGVGCRRGVSREQVMEAIEGSLKQIGISPKSIRGLYSIELKADEAGIIKAAQTLGIPFHTFSAQAIQSMNEQQGLRPSEYVKEKIGVDGVCEAASLLGTSQGELVLPKQKWNGVTVAISKARSMW